MVPRDRIINLDFVRNDLQNRRFQSAEIHESITGVRHNITCNDVDKLIENIINQSKTIKHKRIAIAYNIKNEMLLVDIYPVTGTA